MTPLTQTIEIAETEADVDFAPQRIMLEGEVPSPDKTYPGCPFANRCPIVESRCRETVPLLEGKRHQVACIKAEPGYVAHMGHNHRLATCLVRRYNQKKTGNIS